MAKPTLVTTVRDLRALLDTHRRDERTVGFVPTMGYLHDGHGSLMREASRSSDVVVVSIFVNPLQFGPDEDLEAYPRDLDRDVEVAAEAGVDLLFVPEAEEMYAAPVVTTVSVGEVSEPLDGRSRPGHFDGVATVVAKLFNIVGPCNAYFGAKDFQQMAVIRRMVADLSYPVTVVACPTVRERDGLAMSSRNSYLTVEERDAAPVIHRALQAGAAAIAAGEQDPATVTELVGAIIEAEPLTRLDYVAALDADSLAVPEELTGNVRLFAAVHLGRARLIDNVGVTV
jgi:pantoate--beta-alanine ligase